MNGEITIKNVDHDHEIHFFLPDGHTMKPGKARKKRIAESV